jgi:phage shock protein PspC (stress-responsive transcriptional regulator)
MSLADEIEKLRRLRDSGAMTEAEFQRAKALVLDGWRLPAGPPAFNVLHHMTRSTTDRWLGGVCGGLARITPVPSWVWRLGFTLLVLFGGIGLVPYVLLWIFMPSDDAPPPASIKPPEYRDDLS